MNNKILHILPYIIILFFGFIAYFPTFKNDFIWDDFKLIVEEPFIKSWDRVILTFKPDYWINFHPSPGKKYRPLRSLSFTFDYTFWRLNPMGYHITNFVLHFVMSTLIFNFVRKNFFVKDKILAIISSIFFIVYPRLTETVSWIKNRGEIIVGILLLLGLLELSFGLEDSLLTKKSLKLVILFFLSCLTKETCVVIPFIWTGYIMVLYYERDVNFTFSRLKKMFKIIFPVYIIFFIYLLFLFLIIGGGENFNSVVVKDKILLVFNMIKSFTKNLYLIFYPYEFNLLHYLPRKINLVGVLICFLIFCFLIFNRRDKKVLFLIFWIFISLVPASLPLDARPIAEQRLYLSSLGAIILIFYLLKDLQFKIIKMIYILIIVFNIIVVYNRNLVYSNELTLWREAAKKNPFEPTALLNLGKSYLVLSNDIQNAEKVLNKALELVPNDSYVNNNLGLVYVSKGDYEKANYFFEKSIFLNPNFYEPYLNLGNLYFIEKNYDKAYELWKKAEQLAPNNPEVYNNIGLYYVYKDDLIKAKDYFNQAVVISPDFIEARKNLVVVYNKLKQYDIAKEESYRISKLKEQKKFFVKQIKLNE